MGIHTFESFVTWLRSVRDASELPDDDATLRGLFADLRFSGGFDCPACGSSQGKRNSRQEWRCPCGRRTSPTAGTRMHRLHSALSLWLKGYWHIATSENGISALRFQRLYDIGSYETAWRMLKIIRECFDGGSLRGGIKADAPASTACVRIGGRHRRHRPELASFVALDLTPAELRHAAAPSAAAALAAVVDVAPQEHQATAHIMIESFRTHINGTHHGVSVRHLWSYAASFFGRWSGGFFDVDAMVRLLSPPRPPPAPAPCFADAAALQDQLWLAAPS